MLNDFVKTQHYSLEHEIIDKLLTEEMIKKTYAKIELLDLERGKSIPRLLSTVYHDFLTEEITSMVKINKKPTINFRMLQKFIEFKTKSTLPGIF